MYGVCTLALALLAASALAIGDDESIMYGIQTDVLKPGTTEEYVRYAFPLNNTTLLSSFTVCIRTKIIQYREVVPIFSYAFSDRADNALMMFQSRAQLDYYINDQKVSSGLNLRLDDRLFVWHLYCMVITHPAYWIYVDGKLLKEDRLTTPSTDIPLNGTLYIGQEQDRYDGGTDPDQTLSGFAAQFNFWDYVLEERTIKNLAGCLENLRGNVLSSDFATFDQPGVTSEIVPLQSLCTEEPMFVVFPLRRQVTGARIFCGILDGMFFVPEDEKTNNRLHEESNMFTEVCDFKSYRRLLLAGTDEEQEGVWVNFNTGKRLEFTSWFDGEPNNGKNDNCVVLRNDLPQWGDINCEYSNCFSCGMSSKNYFFIRGLCKPDEHRIRFIMDGYVNDRPYFRGYYGMAIFNVGEGTWVFKDTMANLTLATMTMEQPEEYPLGRTVWDVLEPFCDFAVGDKLRLGLSPCTIEEFMCSDGSCVPRNVRCNLREDCVDGSDENDCGIVLFSGRYASHRPPPGRTYREVLYIQPHVHIVRFSKIDDINLAFYMEFEVHLTWTDRNLKFKNIKEEEDKNKLSTEEVDSIWTPEIEFLNVNDGLLKKLKSNVYARQTGEAEPPDFNDAMMETVYLPNNVALVSKTFYSASFSCNFYLFSYPFDTQMCSVLIELDSADTSVVNFINESVIYTGLMTLPKYDIQKITSNLSVNSDYAVLEVEFTLERRWSLLVLTIFIPTILLLGIGYVTLFIRLAEFEVRAVMTLTTLLVLYTLFNQVSSDLPDTAYIKMIDTWFFFCIFLIFAVNVLHVLVEHLPATENNIIKISPNSDNVRVSKLRKVTGPWTMRTMRVIAFPIVVFVFNLVFWLTILAVG
ncbi:uncharacterized protein [Penaeus vannamei]|uniref:uncharacterized protein n=1 Tax=Penaeus vannamei TaxID=6689 RepID=UPI00387F7491